MNFFLYSLHTILGVGLGVLAHCLYGIYKFRRGGVEKEIGEGVKKKVTFKESSRKLLYKT